MRERKANQFIIKFIHGKNDFVNKNNFAMKIILFGSSKTVM